MTNDDPSMKWGKEAECRLDFADTLAARVVQAESLHSRAALCSQPFDLIAMKSEVLRPDLDGRMK